MVEMRDSVVGMTFISVFKEGLFRSALKPVQRYKGLIVSL